MRVSVSGVYGSSASFASEASHGLIIPGMSSVAAVIVIATLIMMTTGKVPAALALICALVVAGLIGIATPAQLFAGLSNGGVITIAAMLVIAKGVLHTGLCRGSPIVCWPA